MTAAAAIRLRSDVRAVSRDGGQLLLVPAARDARPVRLSPAVIAVLPMLLDGASEAAMAAQLRARFPGATDVEAKLAALLAQLGSTGLLAGATAAPREPARFKLPNPDRIAHWLARILAAVPPVVLHALAVTAAVAAAIGVLALLSGGLALTAFATDFHPLAVVWVLAIHIPLHELAHAVASRYVGVPVAGAGLQGGFPLPTPFIQTPLAYTLTRRTDRALIPLAGPLVDLVAAGAASWIAVTAPHGALGAIARWVAAFLVLALFFNTNPLRATDGSRIAEAVLDDDLARRSALARARQRLSSPLTVIRYRLLVGLHLAVFAGVVGHMAAVAA